MRFLRAFGWAVVPLAVSIVGSCSSGPGNSGENGLKTPARATAATAADSADRAVELERNAALAGSFARIGWLEEAALEHQWLVDNHPSSQLAVNARDRISAIREEILLLKEWKAKSESFDSIVNNAQGRPERLASARKEAAVLASCPYRFVAESARRRLGKAESAAREKAYASLEKVLEKAEAAADSGRWSEAFESFGAFDPALAELFDDLASRFEAARTRVQDGALASAEQRMRAAAAMSAQGDHEAALREMIVVVSDFRGLPFLPEILEAAEVMRAAAREWIISERSIPGSPPPDGIARVRSPTARPTVEAVPAAARERAVEAILAQPVIEETPKPEAMFEGADPPLAAADAWYYKAVSYEIRALPGDAGRKKLLAAAAAGYSAVRKAYVRLLELNRKPDEAIQKRMDLARKAAAWCTKLESTEDE